MFNVVCWAEVEVIGLSVLVQ